LPEQVISSSEMRQVGDAKALHEIARSFLGELLKYVVNSRLPIERLRQSITSLSRAAGMRLAEAEFSVDLGLEEEDSQGFGITPT
jgi:hypothetical protein